ncbi:cation diffusion facilitator family transporter [Gorillibacterium timonense]|uniref:cation diffusion facilitator family transporter n=1 Tax=Gorillibacterium timonense TaxID=1689269 RepID=UPI00071E4DAE|nr:cation diffusion facilitator family transporter [Gorillibacterium timonense]
MADEENIRDKTKGMEQAAVTEAYSRQATRVLLISLAGMLVTAAVQAVICVYSGSVALLADTIHNFGDALTSIPLWIAFVLCKRPPSKRFTYGLGRTEDLAGLFIVAVILASAGVAGYQSIQRLAHPAEQTHLGVTAAAALIGFIGNEIVAGYRIRMGRKLGSAALVADGQHARMDGITSLAVIAGVAGSWLGYPILDPIVGLGITVMILFIAKDTAKLVFTRMLDGIEPETVERITQTAGRIPGVRAVSEVKARWSGHEIKMELSISVDTELTVRDAHRIAQEVNHELLHEIEHVGSVYVHVDPVEETGPEFHTHEALDRCCPESGSLRERLSG